MLFIYTPHPHIYPGYVVVGVSAPLMLRKKGGSIKGGAAIRPGNANGQGQAEHEEEGENSIMSNNLFKGVRA